MPKLKISKSWQGTRWARGKPRNFVELGSIWDGQSWWSSRLGGDVKGVCRTLVFPYLKAGDICRSASIAIHLANTFEMMCE
jgi:hypothetical protein